MFSSEGVKPNINEKAIAFAQFRELLEIYASDVVNSCWRAYDEINGLIFKVVQYYLFPLQH